MTSEHKTGLHPDEKFRLGTLGDKLFKMALPPGILMLLAALLIGHFHDDKLSRFFHSYLLAVVFVTTFALGALFFVIIQHLVRARWSVVIRRVAEILSSTFPVLFILVAIGVLIPVVAGNDKLYDWNNEARMASDHLLHKKAAWLNPIGFAIRICIYFGIWTAMSRYFFKKSVEQDETGDPKINERLRVIAAPCIIIYALTVAAAGIDLLMTLAPHWYSTMFPVWFFAGCVVSIFALLALVPMGLQQSGRLTRSVTVEHYHDVGKLLFGFLMFWAYVSFSQFMLQWYGNMPEETMFWQHRIFGEYQWMAWVILLGHFAFPYLILMSRETKRRKPALAAFALWLLLMHALDLYWMIMPEYGHGAVSFKSVFMDLLALGGATLVFIGAAAREGRKVNLIPVRDPGLGDSLRFENF
jgi:hypothetical protein